MGEPFSLRQLQAQCGRLQKAAGADFSAFPAEEVGRMAVKVRQIAEYIGKVDQRLINEVGPRIKQVSASFSEFKSRMG